MTSIILFLLEWGGSFLIIFGLLLLASKKASQPKIRMKGLIIASIGCTILGIFGLIINAYGVMITQLSATIIDIYGIINCRNEMKLAKQKVENVI